MRVVDHLEELRKRIFFLLILFILFTVFGIYFSPILIEHIINWLGAGDYRLVSLSPLEYLMTQVRVGLYLGLIALVPFVIFHIIMFIKPAFKGKEHKAVIMVLPSILLFGLMGIIFGLLIVELSFPFLAALSPESIANTWSISSYMNTMLSILLGTAIIFQAPLIMIILSKMGIIRISSIKRPYIYILGFIVAALLTPPDAVSQILVAVPLILLFEFTLIISKILK